MYHSLQYKMDKGIEMWENSGLNFSDTSNFLDNQWDMELLKHY